MSTTERIHFTNPAGHQLAAILELPVIPIKCFAVFAHCFSCGKDILVAARVARSLAANGIAVLRFDFTGIGDSEGAFEQSTFSSNIQDIISAADYLRQHYQAPQLLIGHSLGGTAMLNAAEKIPESKALVTIGAPATAEHILTHFQEAVEALNHEDKVTLDIGKKSLVINREFVADLKQQSSTDRIGRLRKALLVLHSPVDDTVDIEEATKIFIAAKHPKSFVSLDNADHLLSHKDDAHYVANTIIAWAARYIAIPIDAEREISKGEVFIGEGNKNFLREVASDDHIWLSDEPSAVGGDNLGPDPYEQLLAALGTCTSMTLRMYANHKGWPVEDIHVQLKHSRQHDVDCESPDKNSCKIELLEKWITITGDLDEQQISRLTDVADRCPVHKTLLTDMKIKSNFTFKPVQ